MVARILIALSVALLLAAPAESTSIEIVDAETAASLIDEDPPTLVASSEQTVPERAVFAPERNELAPDSAVLARVFRPPRSSFD